MTGLGLSTSGSAQGSEIGVPSQSPSLNCSTFLPYLYFEHVCGTFALRTSLLEPCPTPALVSVSLPCSTYLWIYEDFSAFVDDNVCAISNLCMTMTGQSAGASSIANHVASSVIDKPQLRIAMIQSHGLFPSAEQQIFVSSIWTRTLKFPNPEGRN